MSIHKVLRLTQRRSFVTSLFGLTFIGACLTVSASSFLPCPVVPNRTGFSDTSFEGRMEAKEGEVRVAKRPRRWIEEKLPE